MSSLLSIPALAALAIYACPSEGPRNNDAWVAVPKPVASARPARPRDTAAIPRPGALKTFEDWTVGCDNTLSCELRSLEDDNAPTGATISISRAAGPEGRISLSIIGEAVGRKNPTPQIDGKPFDSPARAVATMANAGELTVLAAGRPVATVSLIGAAAALRYVDAMQGRAGTVTALVAHGPKPARAVPAALPAPTIIALTPRGKPATPSEVQIADMRRTADCEATALDSMETGALGGGETLVLLPCSGSAYNMFSALFVLGPRGARPVRADAPLGLAEPSVPGPPPVPLIVNGDWSNGVLSSYAKGRGLADCGVAQEWVWDGGRLRLSSQSEMGVCRGNIDFITTWRASVTRR